MQTNGQYVKTSINSRTQNKKILFGLLGVIVLLVAISVVYIIIYPNL